MISFLAIQNTYTHLEIALFQDNQQLEYRSLTKIEASKACIPALEQLLSAHRLTLKDLNFIAVNQGPGPFTTLRVVIATMNGLSFAQKIPLIGVNALQALLDEYTDAQYAYHIVLLNAFAQDVYYGIQTSHGTFEYGCAPAQQLIVHLQTLAQKNDLLFLGNGAELHQSLITAAFGKQAHFATPLPHTCSIQQIAKAGKALWEKQEDISFQIEPLYIKPAFHS
jgi:tRNA threonylcarbamoyl adenosine modification protein YeaZ